MATTIDAAGRVVIPKALRQSLGLSPGTKIRIEQKDDSLVITHAQSGGEWELEDGRLVLRAPEGTAPLTAEAVRELVEKSRR